MDLLERYLQAVRFFLPRKQQDDIIRELSENLVSQIEDRQEEIGRLLNEDELTGILRRHGHPMVVAGRYRSHQQLIGPVFFPIYVFALKIGLGVALLVTLLVAGVTAIVDVDPIRRLSRALMAYPGRALMVFAWTTLVFAAVDLARGRVKLTQDWDPRTLPKAAHQEDRLSRAQSFCELFFAAGFLVWLLLIPREPFLLFGPAAAILEPGSIWRIAYVPLLLATAATAGLSAVNFVRSYWTPARSLARMAIHALAFVVFAILLRSGELVAARTGAALQNGARVDGIVDLINVGCQIGFLIGCIGSAIEIVREVRRWRSRGHTSMPSNSTPARATH